MTEGQPQPWEEPRRFLRGGALRLPPVVLEVGGGAFFPPVFWDCSPLLCLSNRSRRREEAVRPARVQWETGRRRRRRFWRGKRRGRRRLWSSWRLCQVCPVLLRLFWGPWMATPPGNAGGGGLPPTSGLEMCRGCWKSTDRWHRSVCDFADIWKRSSDRKQPEGKVIHQVALGFRKAAAGSCGSLYTKLYGWEIMECLVCVGFNTS
mmetsp:Transcript_6255/g.12361  ORF Transcript_6255/g.12361 Transcript_6255/m.12361 type:complete len:206 (-) Transcript_6255:31-648(-)